MSRILARISDILSLHPHDIMPALSIFPPIDERSIATRHDLDGKAKSDGQKNVPASDAHDLGSTEQQIISALSNIRQQGLSDFAQESKLYEQRMQGIDLDGRISQITLSVLDGIKTLQHIAHTGRGHIYSFRDDVSEKEKYASLFKERNRLERPASEPRNLVWSFGVLGVLFLIETSVNGVFLSANNILGLIGGVGFAVGIAFVNLAAAVLLGRATTYANHIKIVKKLGGVLALLVAIAFAATFNFLIAHFRDAVAVLPWDEAARAAVQRFLANPLQLDSVESVVLLAVGIVFATFAFLDGLTWSDLYPGYASIVRHRDLAREAYAHEVEARVDDLAAAKDETLAAIHQARADLASTARNYLQAYHGRIALRTGLSVFLDDVDQKANALLARYREGNRATRTSEPPKYFAERFAFGRPVFVTDDGAESSQLLTLRRLTDQADQVLEERAAELLQIFESEMREYEALKRVAQHG